MLLGQFGWQPSQHSDNTLFSLKSNSLLGMISVPIRKVRFTMQESETELMLRGYGLTTAELFYRMPDYQSVLNTFVWQEYDLAPDHPKLFQFIEYWQDEIEGPLHSVRFTHRKMISPGEWQNVVGEFTYH